MNRRLTWITGLCACVTMMALAACGSAATPAAPTQAPTTAPAVQATDTSAPAAPTAAATDTTAPAAQATDTVAATTEVTATSATTATESTSGATEEPAKPSNPGGTGPAVSLTGDAKAGAQIFVDQCKKCHGDEGKGGISNPGSTDGTIPPLNPIDSTLVNKDPKIFAANIDLFIEHGSTPGGTNPKNVMTAFGDEKKLTPQQIADVMAYVISLNP